MSTDVDHFIEELNRSLSALAPVREKGWRTIPVIIESTPKGPHSRVIEDLIYSDGLVRPTDVTYLPSRVFYGIDHPDHLAWNRARGGMKL